MRKSVSVSNFELLSIQNIIKEGNLDLLQQLLIQGELLLTFEDVYKNSLLHIAISYNQYSICKYVIEEGININHVNIWHMTPLEQSIHMKFDKISELLRKHNAYYKNQLDSQQIIFGERDLFFENITIIIDNLKLFFASCIQINFFHNNYQSDYLFCCSKYFSTNNSFKNHVSNLILSLDMEFLTKHEFIIKTMNNSNEFLFLPYCKLFQIEQLIILPLKLNHILIGYFFVWNSKIEIYKKQYENLVCKIMLGEYFEILQFSLESYFYNKKNSIIKKYLNQSIKKIQQRFLNYETHVIIMKFLENIMIYWNDLKTDVEFQNMVLMIAYYQKTMIPTHSCYKLLEFNTSLYNRLCENNIIDKNMIMNFESYPFQELQHVGFDDIEFQIRNETNMSLFDYFNIIGKDVTKRQYEKLEYLYRSFDYTMFSFQIYYEIQKILFNRQDIRYSNVLGIKNKYEHTFFVCHEEVERGIEFVFEQAKKIKSPFTKIYYLFYTISQFIHPFIDGNGRTCRLVLNFYLKKFGCIHCISKKDKMISFHEYKSKFIT